MINQQEADVSASQISVIGEMALLWEIASSDVNALQPRIWAFTRQLAQLEGIVEARAGIGNVLVRFEPTHWTPETLRIELETVWQDSHEMLTSLPAIEVQVRYGGEDGPDLTHVAQLLGISEADVIARHTASTHIVAAIGAMPGFAYLLNPDASLDVRRRQTPRVEVPEGAVVLGGGMSGIISRTSPSGWHIIGFTDCRIFDPHRDPPCLLAAGQPVRFVAQEQT